MKVFIFCLGLFSFALSAPQADRVRIVNGQRATNTPFLCGVLMYGDIWCGCSIIDKKYVLTAAHCFPPSASSSMYRVSVGSLEWRSGKQIPVERIIPHEKFNQTDYDNDICLLKLVEELTYSNNLKPIALPNANSPLPYKQDATVTGYGFTKANGDDMQENALQVTVPVLYENDNSCKIHELTGNNFCAGNNGEAKADSCQGDSGGPLEYNNQIIGIVSYGINCNEPDAAGVYTKVTNYIDWINNKKDIYG